MEQYIPLIIGVVFLLFVLFGFIWGLIRGLKKSAFRISWILVTALILFFVTPLITVGVMKLDISFLGIVIENTKITTLNHLVEVFISQIPDYGELLTKNPETLQMLVTLVTLFINAFVYVLLFWIVKMVLWPVWAILSAVLIRKKDKQGNKKPKHRLFGALVGTFAGIFVGATTLMPIMGVVNMATEVETETSSTYTKKVTNSETGLEEEVTLEGGQISQLLGEEVTKYLNAYSNSFVAGAFKYTGIEFLSNAAYAGLSSATIDDRKIVLKDEVKTIFKTVGAVNTLSNLDFENLTKEKIAQILTASKTLVNHVFEINIVNAIGDNLMPIIMDEILNNPNFIVKLPSTGTQTFDDAIKQGLTELKDFKFSEFKGELLAVLDVAEILNNAGALEKIAQGAEFQDITILLTDQVVESFNNKLFEMQTMSTLMPIAVNSGLTYLAEMLEVEGFTVDTESGNTQAVKELFTGITSTIFAISNSLDLDSKYYITNTTLPTVGKLLNSVKDYDGLTATNYQKLIDAVETKLVTEASNMLDGLDAELVGVKDEVLKAINNLSQVTNFENDFTLINNAYSDIMVVLDGLTAETIEIKLTEAGSVLDWLKQTQLFGSAVNPIIVEGLDYSKNLVPEDYSELKTIIDGVKQNVSKVVSWKTELTIVKDIVDVATKVFEASDLKSALLSADSTLLKDLGKGLNSLNSSTLFGGEVKNIVKILLDQVAGVESGNSNMLTTTLSEIKQNINDALNINWETEFDTLKTMLNGLMDLANDSSDSEAITKAGATLDDVVAANSTLINEDVVKTLIEITIDQFAGAVETGSDLEKVITNVKTTLTETDGLCYENELTALNSVFNEISDIDTSGNNFYTEFGTILDNYDVTYGTTKSVVVSNARPEIVKMVINKVNTSNMDADMVTIVNKIKDNVNTLEALNKQNKYKIEFEHIKTFVDEVDSLTSVDVNTFEFGAFGTMLDGFSDSVLLAPVRADVLNFVVNKAQSSLTSTVTQIATAITEILNHTKTLSTSVTNGTLTYNKVFTDLGNVKTLTDSLATVEITRTDEGINAIAQFGETLTSLDSLVVVPHIATVRIAEYVTSQVVGDSGIKAIMPSEFEANDALNKVYEDAIGVIQPIKTKYANYLTAPDNTTFNFTQDFKEIRDVIADADTKLTEAGYTRPTA